MKNIIKFILFLIYSISIFFIYNYIVILIIAIIHVLLMILLKINMKNAIHNLCLILPFILFTSIINICLADINFALLIGVRLILVCNITYIFSKTISKIEFAKVIQNMAYPLRIFRINPRDIGIIINIALCFMPILKNELQDIKNTLKVKGIKTYGINIIKNANIILRPLFISMLQRLAEMDVVLRVKGYK